MSTRHGISLDKKIFQPPFERLHELGCKNVVVTLGASGVMFSEGRTVEFVAAPKVQAVDTTGAGDCFVGWLGVGVAEGLSLRASTERACKAASIKVTRAGAQDGMPYRQEVVSASASVSCQCQSVVSGVAGVHQNGQFDRDLAISMMLQ